MKDIAPYISIALAILVLSYTVTRNRNKDVGELSARLSKLETQMEVLWRGVSFSAQVAATVLHSPHPEHARRDWLLENLQDLDARQTEELRVMMVLVMEDKTIDLHARWAATAILNYLLVQAERLAGGGVKR